MDFDDTFEERLYSLPGAAGAVMRGCCGGDVLASFCDLCLWLRTRC